MGGRFIYFKLFRLIFLLCAIVAKILVLAFYCCEGCSVLTTLFISEYAIAEKLQLEIKPGMTAITGETGAGKSISLDALSLALGARSDSGAVREGAARTDISAVFDINKLVSIQSWLKQNDLDDSNECILRRTVSAEGRSKAYINGYPVNLSTLNQLGHRLVDIHSQHAHHQLLKREHHQYLLDAFAKNDDLLQRCQTSFAAWQSVLKEIKVIEDGQHEASQRQEFLSFQLEEFQQLQLEVGEYQQLEARHAMASQTDALIAACQHTISICKEDEQALLDQLHSCLARLERFSEHSKNIQEACELLASATIQIDEASQLLRQQVDHQESNEDLESIEERLSAILTLARKQKVLPDQLLALQERLENELQNLEMSDNKLTELSFKAKQLYKDYENYAQQLTITREKAAEELSKDIHQQLALLGMSHCHFSVALNTTPLSGNSKGFEQAEFLISTNPASQAQALSKIASGGELSRISLAIQVVTAKASTIPVLIFDEVDVGIGGATAEVVGRLLKELSKSAQVICVTHQAQVASYADQHLLVSKKIENNFINTQVKQLSKKERIEELARMVGGVEITEVTLKHAEEMLNKAES